MSPRRTDRTEKQDPADRILQLATEAIACAKKARKHKQALTGDNFYANKMARLRVEAANAFSELPAGSPATTSALVELIDTTFSTNKTPGDRLTAERELAYSIATGVPKNSTAPTGMTESEDSDLFPLSLLSETKRSYLPAIGIQINGAFSKGWFDACAVMMRRLLEMVIIEAFEAKGLGARITDSNDDYFQLTELIGVALSEPTLKPSRNVKNALPKLRTLGHRSAHGRFFFARKGDIEKHEEDFRVTIEEYLRHANLL